MTRLVNPTRTPFGGYWDAKRKRTQDAKLTGECLIEKGVGRYKTLVVSCPPQTDFSAEAIVMGGKYRVSTGTWTFPYRFTGRVEELCHRMFPGKVRDLRVAARDGRPGN